MTAAHRTFRELVAHLGRAQRAFDDRRLDEAEQAIAQALEIDPDNVQAADLRQRIRKQRGPAAPPRSRAAAAPPPPSAPVAPRPTGAAPPGRVFQDAWSAFEQRVGARRADKAVAEARDAIGRGDAEAAEAALTELDAVSPGDSRRVAIEASLGAEHINRPAPIRAAVARPAAAQRIDAVGPALDVDMPLALNLEISPALEREIARAIESRPFQTPTLTRRRRWPRAAAACGVIAASGLLGFWLLTAQTPDSVSLTSSEASRVGDSTGEPGVAPEGAAPDSASPNSALPEVAQFDTAAPAATNPDDATLDPPAGAPDALLNPNEMDAAASPPTGSKPLPGATGTTLSSTTTVGHETVDAPTPLSRPGLAAGMPGSSAGAPLRPVDRPVDRPAE